MNPSKKYLFILWRTTCLDLFKWLMQPYLMKKSTTVTGQSVIQAFPSIIATQNAFFPHF
jgi:hypothetical protein